MEGRIIKGIAGFYYVYLEDVGAYECKAKGIFRNMNMKPLVGDYVSMDVLDPEQKTGNITEILPRKNELIRPAVANIDQAVILLALKQPNPNLNLLDRFLVMMEQQNIKTTICFNKLDIADEFSVNQIRDYYGNTGYRVIFTSTVTLMGMDSIRDVLDGKTTVLAGPSGVGKSSMLNVLTNQYTMETGSVSERIGRGRHTTRHSQMFRIGSHTYLFDTPGFSSFSVPDISKEQLEDLFPEFSVYKKQCKFVGCSHIKEPDCGVKHALDLKQISLGRYENYKLLYEELRNKETIY